MSIKFISFLLFSRPSLNCAVVYCLLLNIHPWGHVPCVIYITILCCECWTSDGEHHSVIRSPLSHSNWLFIHQITPELNTTFPFHSQFLPIQICVHVHIYCELEWMISADSFFFSYPLSAGSFSIHFVLAVVATSKILILYLMHPM